MNKFNPLNNDRAVFEIGGASAPVSRDTLQELVDAVYWLQAHLLSSKEEVLPAPRKSGSEWIAIGWLRSKRVYTLNLRGLNWEVPEIEMATFVREVATPALMQ